MRGLPSPKIDPRCFRMLQQVFFNLRIETALLVFYGIMHDDLKTRRRWYGNNGKNRPQVRNRPKEELRE